MGTSTSSKGPQGGVSFDPPWLDQITTDIQPSGNDISDTNDVIRACKLFCVSSIFYK